ncbi:hypothetical protein BDV25DRAFT_168860 [Aspergillus avenaceus]|uniref:DNA polymerase n=1 Tax=Aspergillus avenaceus TaxID=36643 RepID=A0A5N6TN77_ASPAV|nr:hypothetical protein BDV25DRAFT_168860 [Aspergillus avenaceus]
MEPFQVRLNCVDHYQAAPSEFDPPFPYRDGAPGTNDRSKVPVIRIFGATETGQKVCVHVHGAFPYLYIPYEGGLSQEEVSGAIRDLHASIDEALAVNYRRNEYDKKPAFVAHITLVKGVPFYGYHVGYHFFFKIYLLSPAYTTRLADLLLQGAVLKRSLQPYESHLQYIPQWMCDYSLYGCSYMKCSKVKFRSPVPEYFELTNLAHRWHDRSVPPEDISDVSFLPKQSHCPLEVDVCVQDILNRLDVRERPIHHDFTELLKPVSQNERLVPSMEGLWQDETRRRKKRLGLDDPGSSPFGPEELVSLSADPRNQARGGWIHEEEFRELTLRRAAEEKRRAGGKAIELDAFIKQNSLGNDIKTVLESVEDLYPSNNPNLQGRPNFDLDKPKDVGADNDERANIPAESDMGSYCLDDDVTDIFSDEDNGDGNDATDDPLEDVLLDVPPEERAELDSRLSKSFTHHNPLDKGDLPGERHIVRTVGERNYMNSEEIRKKDIHDGNKSLKRAAQDEIVNDVVNKRPKYSVNLAPMIHEAFNISPSSHLRCFRLACPSPSEVSLTLNDYGCPSVIYEKAHYSEENDVPDRPRGYAGREFRLQGKSIHYLPDFDPSGLSPAMLGEQTTATKDRQQQEEVDRYLRESSTSKIWEFAPVPPTRSDVVQWLETMQLEQNEQNDQSKQRIREPEAKPNILSQIEGPTQKNEYGFKYSQKARSASVEHQTQYMSIMSLEVHINTRGVLAPNPDEDEIAFISWSIQSDDGELDGNSHIPGVHVGMVFQGENDRPELFKALKIDVEQEPTELDLITRLVDIVRFHDPDIITGYEVHNSSWGYVIERARKKYEFDLCDELSRVKSQAHGRFGKDADKWGFNHTSSIRVTGRHMINIWRAMRSELNLLQYSMENVVFHLLHRRIPHYPFRDLTTWYQSGKPRQLLKVVDYFVSRVQMDLELLESNELIPRTSEQARLLGIDFFSVFSRGSQFKVESLMFRIAKPENFLLVSPSRKQVGQQNALECLPLVMEPQSDFYTSPLLVLDFQSLYPSIMIAYNYCYSTFLGRVHQWRGRDKMGFTEYERQPGLLELLKDKINIAPNGMIYAKPEVRKSLLAKMLAEILETRVMVKTGMKLDKDDKTLQRLLNNRQLALKLIANVTYGYTSASFSGRMPCSEIADSIVQSGRETLEKAIALIHSVERWGAEVVYGDTDSLFVYLKGRTRDEAFDIGEEIAQAVTSTNPSPVKLKFEKVYHPCVLLAKKRYVGFKYEHREQKEPEFDAKGIETIEEKALKLLFRTADLSQILQGRVSIQDFCFAREVRLGTYSERGLPPPGALISTKKMLQDPRLEPQYGERVPYVVVTGAPGSRLIDRCVPPETLLHDAQLDLDAEYYITKNIIPPLERIFNLVGANVRQWYDEMPKYQRIRRVEGTATNTGKDVRKTLESYMKSSKCIICRTRLEDTDVSVCAECTRQPHVSLLDLMTRQRQAEKSVSDLLRVCRSCMGVPAGEDVNCDSKDCPVFYARTRHLANWRHTKAALGPVVRVLQDKSEKELEW